MKKTLLFLLVLTSIISGAFAQSGGPDQYGYIWRDNTDPQGPVYNWIEIKGIPSAEPITGLSDDNLVGPFNLPAPFPYYWYTVNQYWIGSNGYISFGTANLASPFGLIPSTASPQNFLAVMLSDLNFTGPGNTGTCWRWASPAGDTVVVTWDSVPFWQAAAPTYNGFNTFQVVLNYNDSSITFQYKDQNGISTGSTVDFMTVGIENNSGNIGLQVSHDAYPTPQSAVRFYAPATTTLQINDASTTYIDNVENAALFLSAGGAPFNIKANVKNTGNTTLNPFNVGTTVRNANNATLLTVTTATDTLLAGDNQLLLYPNPYTPVTAGALRVITGTQLAGDATPSNNQRTLELQVVDTTLNEIELSYDDGTNSGGGIAWSGGNAGASNYFIPPFYPCNLTKVKAFISADPSLFGYSMMVYDDNGPNGLAGTLLDSVNVPGGFTTGAFITTTLTTPISITSGGFYVTWYMGGADVTLGTNAVSSTVSASNRGYEVLANNYSEWRSREVQDLMIRAVIQRIGVGTEELNADASNLYPNPATNRVTIELNNEINSAKAMLEVSDMNGRLIYRDHLQSHNKKVMLDVSSFSNGLYTIRIQDGATMMTKKLNVVH